MAKHRPLTASSRDDNDGTFIFYAKLAARNEAEGNLEEAQIMWLRAKPVANKEVNREWASLRAEVCKQRMNKWSPV